MRTDTRPSSAIPTFTDVTWANAVPGGYLSRDARQKDRRLDSWPGMHDLAVDAMRSGEDRVPFEVLNLLVGATLSGLPVTIKRRGRDGQTFTNTVIVEHMGRPRWTNGTLQGLFHVRAWGGAHPVYYTELIAAGTPESVFEFDCHGQHHTMIHPAFGEDTREVTEVTS